MFWGNLIANLVHSELANREHKLAQKWSCSLVCNPNDFHKVSLKSGQTHNPADQRHQEYKMLGGRDELSLCGDWSYPENKVHSLGRVDFICDIINFCGTDQSKRKTATPVSPISPLTRNTTVIQTLVVPRWQLLSFWDRLPSSERLIAFFFFGVAPF